MSPNCCLQLITWLFHLKQTGVLCTVASLLFAFAAVSQTPPTPNFKHAATASANNPIVFLDPVPAENCNNGIDDNNNGLIDLKDYACYYAQTNTDTCISSKIVWAILSSSLYWLDLETGQDHSIPLTGMQNGCTDLAWAPNGKLYISTFFSGKIQELDPHTAQTTTEDSIPGYYFINGMVADAQSNLYLTCLTSYNGRWDVVKYNPTSRISSVVATLSGSGLVSAGDITFLNGYLYVACNNSKLAKINPSTGSLQVINYTGAGTSSSYGLMTLNDGFLYTCMIDKIYRLDPNTWVGTEYIQLPTYGAIQGLSTYSDICDAPACRARVRIETQTSQPFCAQTGVKLKAVGTGINLSSRYDWTLPDNSVRTGDTLTAFASGTYYVRFHNMPDTCGKIDSIVLNIMQPPGIWLGNDTVVCANSSILLVPASNSSNISQYTWLNGSHNASIAVTEPGLYWVTVTNTCGSATDSIQVTAAAKPQVQLPSDTSLCPGNSLQLQNLFLKSSTDHYTWSNGSSGESLTASSPGIYWLRSINSCGTTTDNIIISFIDSCICKPFTAAVNLGSNQQICRLDTMFLQNSLQQQGYRYLWQDGSTNSFYNVTRPGIYWADVTTYCNTVRDTVLVTGKENCECNVYFPNAFTPNNDNRNDLFKPLCICILTGELNIYNRWGQLVYKSAKLDEGWNGQFKGMDAAAGVYVYYLHYGIKNRPGKEYKKGTVMIIR